MSESTVEHVPMGPVVLGDGTDITEDLVQIHDAAHAAVESVEETKPEPKEEIITPRDTVDALRLIRKMKLIEPDDDNETRTHIRNVVVTWISQKRAGTTNQDFDTWYTTPELNDEDDAATEGSEDPT